MTGPVKTIHFLNNRKYELHSPLNSSCTELSKRSWFQGKRQYIDQVMVSLLSPFLWFFSIAREYAGFRKMKKSISLFFFLVWIYVRTYVRSCMHIWSGVRGSKTEVSRSAIKKYNNGGQTRGGPTISRDKRLQNVAPRGTAFNC